MVRSTLFLIAALGLPVSSTLVGDAQTVLSKARLTFSETCQELSDSVSAASAIYYDGSPEYREDIRHWVVLNTQQAACSFRPSTVEDVSIALRILGQTRTPFAVKGGGHSTNPGFSSTPGVQIAMSGFSEVLYDSSTQTATVGAGLLWDDVYAALEPYGVSVVGGRLPGVGVAGFTLGGGYSWHTSQRGLTIDTVQMYELVKPNGIAINVTESSYPDLFVALKGGGNNFGIVTRFTFKTYPQTQVWSCTLTYKSAYIDHVIQAVANFAADNTDPKATAIISYIYRDGEPSVALWGFYDAPTQPAGIFDEFLAIPHGGEPLVQSFFSFVTSIPSRDREARGVFNAVSATNISTSLLEAVANQSKYWGQHLSGSLTLVSYGIHPFLPTLFNHNTTSSAYPPDRTRAFFPISLYFEWVSPEVDQIGYDGIRASARALQELIDQLDNHDDGHKEAIYPNYALFGTPLDDMYGANLPNLQAIHAEVDPENVMGLAGGFKF